MGSEPDISKMRRTSLEAGTHWAGCENDHIECYIMHLRSRLAACEEALTDIIDSTHCSCPCCEKVHPIATAALKETSRG